MTIEYRRTNHIAGLGAKNSGKSTVIRQMKKIAEAEYESDKDMEKIKNDEE